MGQIGVVWEHPRNGQRGHPFFDVFVGAKSPDGDLQRLRVQKAV
jgi:hypothetical protein